MHVFLSFHSPDREHALALAAAIRQAIPDADVFVDRTHLRYGYLWQPALFEAINNSRAFLVLISNQLGDWQKVEYYEARDKKAKDDNFVLLPIIIADKTKGPTANLPGLAQLHWIETTEPTAPEPLSRIIAALNTGKIPKPPEPWRAINPYRGLLALEEQDADFFFGRDFETGKILNSIIAHPGRLITLIGNSGVGKSSLIQAGVVGSLRRQRWPIPADAWPTALKDTRAWAFLSMRPGENPVGSLVSAFVALWFADVLDPNRIARRNQWTDLLKKEEAGLSDLIDATYAHFRDELGLAPPRRILLYVDQGEELYARAPKHQLKRFSDILAQGLHDPRLIAMTSQRADYYGQLQANEALFALTECIDVPPLGTGALKAILGEPARVLGVQFESDELINHVVIAAADQPGALPLLADLFTDLWERMRVRGDGMLRVADRKEIIQVGAALAQRADAFVAGHPAQINAIKRLFTLRLAHVPRHGDPVRRRMVRATNREDEWQLVQTLASPEWRLLVTSENDGQATAEVAHEVLLKTWPTLDGWLKDQREFLIWRDEVEILRDRHDKAVGRRRRDALLMGLQLIQAEQWFKARRDDIEPPEQRFIEESRLAARYRRRALQTAASIAFVLLAVFAVFGWWNWSSAKKQTELANHALDDARHQRDQVLIQQSRSLAAFAKQQTQNGNTNLGVLLSLAALPESQEQNRPYVSDAEYALYDAVSKFVDIAPFSDPAKVITNVSIDSTRRQIATADFQGQLLLTQVNSDGPTITLQARPFRTRTIALSPDASALAVGQNDGEITIYNLETRTEVVKFDGHEGAVLRLLWSDDGKQIASSGADGTVRIWSFAEKRERARFHLHQGPVHHLVSLSNGRILSAGSDGALILWDQRSRRHIATLREKGSAITDVAVDSKQSIVVVAIQNDSPLIADFRGAAPSLFSMSGAARNTIRVAVTPDGRRLVTVDKAGAPTLWDTERGARLIEMESQHGSPIDMDISPDGALLALADSKGELAIWDLASGQRMATARNESPIQWARFGHTGRQIFGLSASGHLSVWKFYDPRLFDMAIASASPQFLALSPDGQVFVLAWDGTIQSINVNDLQNTSRSQIPNVKLVSAMSSPQGSSILARTMDERFIVFNTAMPADTIIFEGHKDLISAVAFVRDGAQIVSASEDGSVRLWDASDGRSITTLLAGSRVRHLAAPKHEPKVVAADDDGNIIVIDIEARRVLSKVVLPDTRVSSLDVSADARIALVAAGAGKLFAIGLLEGQYSYKQGPSLSSIVSIIKTTRDGSFGIATLAGGDLALWDLHTNSIVAQVKEHKSDIVSIQLISDRRFITFSLDGTARLWALDSRGLYQLSVFSGVGAPLRGGVADVNGSLIGAISENGRVIIWRTFPNLQSLSAAAKSSIRGTQLTPYEARRFYLGTED